MLDTHKWEQLLAFDLAMEKEPYGFATRLATEQKWTLYFTEKAIIEYKKFMYLASVSAEMISPSPVVDEVWHLHLTFTGSYTDFCAILGKRIEHIPSTHQPSERMRFKKAMERTKEIYTQYFGEMPAPWWSHPDQISSLQLKPKHLSLGHVVLLVGVCFVGLTGLLYPLLFDFYAHLPNVVFIPAFLLSALVMFVLLEWYNRSRMKRIMAEQPADSILKNLHAKEVLFLIKDQRKALLPGTFNDLAENGALEIERVKYIQKISEVPGRNAFEWAVLNSLDETKMYIYPAAMAQALEQPAFKQVETSMVELRDQLCQRSFVIRLQCINLIALLLVFEFGVLRFCVGLSRDKPTGFLQFLLIVMLFAMLGHLFRLSNQFAMQTVPRWYHTHMETKPDHFESRDWKFALLNTIAVGAAFLPIRHYFTPDQYAKPRNGSSGGSTCSSCGGGGGGCGGGCGGCGGD